MQLGQVFVFLRAGRVRGTSWRTTRAMREENIGLLDESSIERCSVAIYVKVAAQTEVMDSNICQIKTSRVNLLLLSCELAATFLSFFHSPFLNDGLFRKHSQEIRFAMANAVQNTDGTSPPTAASTFTILYFATASSFTTLSSEELPAPLPLTKLFPTLESRYPGITKKVLKSCAVTVNLEYVDIEEDSEPKSGSTSEELLIKPGDEVGIIPPVSSG